MSGKPRAWQARLAAPALDRAHSVALHQFPAQIHLHFWAQTAENLLASHRIHRDQLTEEFVPRLFLFVTAPAHADREQQTNPPKDDRSQGDFGEHRFTLEAEAKDFNKADAAPAVTIGDDRGI